MRVQLSGQVMDSSYARLYRKYGFRNVCCPQDIRDAAANCPENEELVFEINSGGGSVYDGFEMYSIIRSLKQPTVAEVQSVAASAASVIAVGCDKVMMSPVANMMIHRASTYAGGNSEDFEKAKQMLDTIDRSILTAYTEKAGGKTDEKTLLKMMQKETFLTAGEAIERGLADGRLFERLERAPEKNLSAAADAMNKGVSAIFAALPPIQELIDRENGSENIRNKEEAEMTLEELKAQNPDLVKQIQDEAAAEERKRIADIQSLSMAGYEDLVEAAQKNPKATAASVEHEIVQRMKQKAGDWMQARAKDADEGNVNNAGNPAVGGGKSAAKELEDALDEAFGKEK